MSTQDIVAKLWNLCNVLRDDGVTYHQYVTEITYLLFLKMAEETDTEVDSKTNTVRIPEGYRWQDLIDIVTDNAKAEKNKKQAKNNGKKIEGDEAKDPLEFYKLLLIHLGSHGSRITRMIYQNATSVIRKPTTLTTLATEIDKLDWYDAKTEGLGDLYEGLLKKNADEKKSGAGQYFTPRVLIDVIVKLMRPNLDDVICDPAAGTGGFLISANQHLHEHNDIKRLSVKAYDKYQHRTFFGMELVLDTHRLAMMNLMLHNLAVDDESSGIIFGDTLSSEGLVLPTNKCSLVLSNPPFGTKQGGGIPTRDDLVHYTSNKQLAFLHLIYHKLLASAGRAAIVLPDNVLFEGSTGKKIRQDLMDKCNLHTILRLPTGIFYAAGVKTNVLFFNKSAVASKDKGNTKNVWVYDLRANMPQFGKRTVLAEEHFSEFIEFFDVEDVKNGKARNLDSHRQKYYKKQIKAGKIEDEIRFRVFSREEISKKDDSLDLAWIRDDDDEDTANLPDPDVLAREAIEELAGAIIELQSVLVELGVEEEGNEVVL